MWKPMLAAVVFAAMLGGCASNAGAPPGVEVSAAGYADAFEAARDVLRERRWLLERVDAPQGVLTTQPRSEPGLARPWDAPPGLDQATEDLLHRQQRVVRIAFVTRGMSDDHFPATDPQRDLLDEPVDTVMRVHVGVERIERPGQRVPVDAIRLASRTIDPELEAQGLLPRYVVELREDPRLGSDIEREIAARLASRR
jgi:hypothetical protein